MKPPRKPQDEARRLQSLRALNVLDTPAEERFDRLTRVAKRAFGVPIALVSLVDQDRQWFKSCQGLDASETARDISFCGHAILGDHVFVVADAACDPRFHDNPLVVGGPRIRFYAGCPLSAPDGSKLGTLCIIDTEPREFDQTDCELLSDIAHMAERELAAVSLATTDELTGLSNRRGFEALAQIALEQCRRNARPASMLFFDLNKFKAINDSFGHAAGDQALCDFAHLLKTVFRGSDVIGRIAGDEFAVVLSGTQHDKLDEALGRFSEVVEQHNARAGRQYELTFSVGAAGYDPQDAACVAELVAAADAVMYQQKHARSAVARCG